MSAKFISLVSASFFLCVIASVHAQAAPDATNASPPATIPPAAAVSTIPTSPALSPNGDMVATLMGSAHFTLLSKAIVASGLAPTLKTQPGLTLFAPTDDAFNALPPAQLSSLMEAKNANTLQRVLTYHLVNLSLDSSKIKGAKGPVVSVEGSKLNIDGSGTPLKVDGADIIQTDVHASNGVIQVVDKVLIPSDVTVPMADGGGAAPAR